MFPSLFDFLPNFIISLLPKSFQLMLKKTPDSELNSMQPEIQPLHFHNT